jgi:hypothetical protein
LQQNISRVSVACLRLPAFSIGMRLRKQQKTCCSWLFRTVFERARLAADRKFMAAGDYHFDGEMASRNSCLSNCVEGRSEIGRLFATRLKRRLRVESGTSPRRIGATGLRRKPTFESGGTGRSDPLETLMPAPPGE